MDNEILRIEFSQRLIECLEETEIPRNKWASTIAVWFNKCRKNPMFARKWLSGESMPTRANMRLLAEHLNVRVEWLEYGIGTKHALSSELQAYIDKAIESLASIPENKRAVALDILRVLCS